MRTTVGWIASGYRRTLGVALVSGGLLVLGLAPASGNESAPAGPAQAAPFSNGAAKATALVVKIAPGVGSLELALGSGIAVSELRNDLAQAQAQSFDLGLIGTTLTAEGCGDAVLTADQLPQPTRVDNRGGDTSATADEVPVAGEALGAGREQAEATKAPSARAVATTAASTGPAISIAGGQATAVTEVVDGVARQARATAQVDLDIAGVVQLSGLRWEALHRTGQGPKAEATFDIGTAQLFGQAIPLESLAAVEDIVNTALADSGLSVQLPRVERFTEPTDLIRITPLRITLRDSKLGALLAGPLLNASREQREQLFTDLSAAYCDLAGVLLVGDIGVSIASGTGFISFDIGGAEAISGEFIAENPFGEPIAPPGAGAPPLTPDSPPTAPTSAGLPAAPAPAPTEATAAPERVAVVGPLEELCETIHPFEWPSCSKGAMAPLGALGLLATVGIGGLDWRHQRRRLSRAATSLADAT